ncbi:ArgS-related anticodon-binding protein NrtL [uncultured Streptomyces sp.]|uniref:ArgS-related anticodon-binding protein NrtL n=1 Tax=uncultured Streptomyces sp. TaxID=174707 RepID=UPI002604525D|nr:DALR anticodon-binding domain-containing protein [uncultured Streptomyces sp.]
MTPADLSRAVLHAVRRAVDENALRAPVPARVRVERTRPGGSGDYACAVALQLAGPAALPPREVARILADRVAAAGVARVDVTGPGFLSFTLDPVGDAGARTALVRDIGARGSAYGHGDALRGETLRLLHPAEIRAETTAAAVAALAAAQGADVRLLAAGPGRAPADAVEIRPVPAGAPAAGLPARLGPDALRWGLLRPAGHDRAPLGDDLLVQSAANPLFLVRYAHARTRALLRNARDLGFGPEAGSETASDGPASPDGGPGRADAHAADAAHPLWVLLADHPAVLVAAARLRAPDRLARHLEAVAHAFFDFHDACPPLPPGDEKPSAAHRSRLALAEAAGTVLAGGLSLLGVSAPEHL